MLRPKRSYPVIFLLFAAILLFMTGGAQAYDSPACNLNLPGPVLMEVTSNEGKNCNTFDQYQSYLNATLYGAPPGSSLPNGNYNSFCADLTGDILHATLQVYLTSSLDPIPLSLKQVTSRDTGITYTIPWDKINYLLNKYPVTADNWLEFQAAAWTVIFGCNPQDNSGLFLCPAERDYPWYFPQGHEGPNAYGCPNNVPRVLDVNRIAAYGRRCPAKRGRVRASGGRYFCHHRQGNGLLVRHARRLRQDKSRSPSSPGPVLPPARVRSATTSGRIAMATAFKTTAIRAWAVSR